MLPIMLIILKVVIGIGVTVLGGYLGIIRCILLSSVFVGGFTSVSLVRFLFRSMSHLLARYLTIPYANVIVFIVLVIPPVLLIPYLSRKLMVKLGLVDTISPTISGILGAGFFAAIFIAILKIL